MEKRGSRAGRTRRTCPTGLTALLLLFALLIPLPASAARILALAPHVCEMLYAIGAGDRIVGAVDYCDYPAAANKLPRIGSYERINVEAALRLKPDLAIVMSRSVIGIGQLERAGVKVVVSNPIGFAAIFADIERLGVLTGHKVEAERLIGQQQARLAALHPQSGSAIPVYYEVWHEPLLTCGGGSFLSELIRLAGGRNVFSDVNLETARVSVEAVARARPAVVAIPAEKRDIAARQKFWRQWLGPKVRFVTVNPDLLHRPGPRLLDGLEQLQKALASGRNQ